MKKSVFSGLVSVLLVVMLAVVCLAGCRGEKTDAVAPSSLDWKANVMGSGGDVTGVGFQAQFQVPDVSPVPRQQLEKGNHRELAAAGPLSSTGAGPRSILPDLPRSPQAGSARIGPTPCPNGICLPQPTPAPTATPARAWYNGFM